VNLFHEHPGMIKLNPVFFLNGYQNLLEALFFIKQHDKFKQTLTSLTSLITIINIIKLNETSMLKSLLPKGMTISEPACRRQANVTF